MPGQRIGPIIAAVFGLIFVLINTGALPAPVGWILRGLGVIAFVAVLIAVWRARAEPRTAAPAGGASPFGRGYWLIVAAEVLALFVGLRVITGPLGHPQGGVAWVSFVVGVHFFALAMLFHAPFFSWLGISVTLCGAVGLILVFTGAAQSWVEIVGGLIPGALLLGCGWWGATSGGGRQTQVGRPAQAR